MDQHRGSPRGRPGPFALTLASASSVSSPLTLPRHVEPYGRARPNPKRQSPVRVRILQSVVDGFLSGPLKRALGRPPRVAAEKTTPTDSSPQTTTTPTPTAITTTCTAALIIFEPRPPLHFVSMPATPGAGPATTITTTTTTTPSPSVSLKSLTKKFSAPQLSRSSSASSLKTTPPSASTSQSLTPTPRRLKASPSPTAQKISKKDTDQDESARASIFRRLSPGLAARLKLLNGSSEQPVHTAPGPGPGPKGVGRIPEDKLQELDSLHRDLSIKVERRGRIWGGAQIKRERSAPDLLQSPTKTGTGTGTRIGIEKELPLQPHPSVFDQPEQSVTIHIDSDPDSPAAAAPMTAVEVAIEPAMDQSTDLEEYLRRSTQDQDQAPAPPPKDTPPAPSTPSSSNVQSYFSPLGLNRTESIFSFSRASFSSQLSQLTSINLPQPTALESSISSIINAPTAVRALIGAAEQIQKWMNKASEVLNGMEAEDDVEWAAAGGREGLDDVDKAVITFESLVDVYVKAIENVQLRDDIDDVRKEDLTLIVAQMESTLKNWANIRHALQGVKEQVELAMEWEELWNNVLGDVGLELDNLSRLIFEMEEGRHKSLVDPETEQGNGLDINELETIVEESPSHGTPSSSKRLSLALFPSSAPQAAAGSSNPHDDANLMQLFARMQPLRASLDFLPMRLSMFQARAERMFPTACQELDDKRKRLETSYKKLEGDAEALRRELGEDRWILVFRNAGKQAQKMCDSVERSISKLQESLEANDPVNNPTAITKKIESYEAKKIHYIPAIGRVMSIIQKGVNDRLTVNGEVLTLLSDMQQRVDALKTSMKVMDSILEETTISKSQQLRDSISSIITDSPANTSLIGTPGSSPASSVIMMTNGSLRTPNAGGSGSSRRGSSVGSASRSVTGRRLSGIPTSSQRKSSAPLSYNSPTSSTLTPSPAPRVRRPSTNTAASNKPRWNSSTNTNDLDTGHNFQPLSVTSPSAYAKNRNSRSISSSLPIPSPLSRATSSSPVPRTASRVGSRLGLRPSSRLGAASPTSPLTPIPSGTASKIRSSTNLPTGLRNRQSYAGTTNPYDDSPSKATRPGTALGMGTSSRRVSLLPQPRSSKTGRDSAAGNRSSSRMDDRPRWR